jgi:hypothetical protein
VTQQNAALVEEAAAAAVGLRADADMLQDTVAVFHVPAAVPGRQATPGGTNRLAAPSS